MPPYILTADRGPEPYEPPVVAHPAPLEAVHAAAAAGAAAPRTTREWRREARIPAHAADVMTADLVTIAPNDPPARAWALMRRHRIRHLPVVSADGVLVGIVSDRDMFRHGERMHELMTRRIVAATADTPVASLARVMLDERIGCVPILTAAQVPVGVVTRTDVLRFAAEVE